MARQFDRSLLFGLLGLAGFTVGGVVLSRSVAAKVPSAPPPPPTKPKAKFKPGDVVTISGGETGEDRTYTVKSAVWSDGQWQYDLGTGAALPQSTLHMVEPVKTESPLVKQAAKIIAPASASLPPAKEPTTMPLPLYPQGLVIQKGAAKGTVKQISRASDGYHYQIEAGFGPFSDSYQGSEAQIRDTLAQKAGQQSYGFAFPVGVTLVAKSQSWEIKNRLDRAATKFYETSQGEISEPELVVKLYQALK